MNKGLIVGIDPGTTVGIAILDVHGNIVDVSSKRQAKKSDIIKHVSKFGNPVIVASDVNPAPNLIKKIASEFGSKLYYPEKSLSNLEKQKVIEDYQKDAKNSHQKDALAAGLKAFKSYRELFQKIEINLEKIDRKEIFDETVTRILEKNSENIKDAIKKILTKR